MRFSLSLGDTSGGGLLVAEGVTRPASISVLKWFLIIWGFFNLRSLNYVIMIEYIVLLPQA